MRATRFAATIAPAVAMALVLPSAASADDGLLLLDRYADDNRLGSDIAVGAVATDIESGFSLLRFDINASAVTRRRRFGAVATLPLIIARQDDTTEAVFGNLEGGVTGRALARSGVLVVARVTLALPTASGSAAGAIANGIGSLVRVSDLALALPETMSARASGSLIYAPGGLFVRADFGLDVPILENSARIDDLSHTPLFRINLALGYVPRAGVQFALESANTLASDDAFAAFGISERTVVHQLGVSARQRLGDLSIGGGLFVDPSSIVESDDGYSIAAIVGVSRAL